MSSSTLDNDILKRANQSWQADDIAQKYARAENATKPYGEIMVKRAGFDKLQGEANVFDLACGTGAVVSALYDALPKEKWGDVKVLGGDVSEAMLTYLKERGAREGWTGLETKIVDATKIDLPKESFTHLFVNFAIFMLPPTTLSTLRTLLRPGGFIGISSWYYFAWYPMVERAVARLPGNPVMPPYADVGSKLHGGSAWNETSYVEKVLKEAGFEDVEVVMEKTNVDCGTPEQFTETMWMPLNMIAGYWDESRRGEWLKGVQEEVKEEAIKLAGGKDGTVWMEFEGIVGTGKKPQ